MTSPSGSNHSVPGYAATLHDAEQALTASEAKRARLAAEATAAKRDLVRIEAATAPARQALAAATGLYEEAWRRHARAQHHLDHSGYPRPTGSPPRP